MTASRPLRRLLQTTLALCAGSAFAQAPLASLSLSFVQPTGTVGATDTIDVEVRLTNDDPTNTFMLGNGLPDFGLVPSDLPTGVSTTDADGTTHEIDFASYTSVAVGLGYGCSSTFTSSTSCGPGAYSFDFSSYLFSDPLSLAPGASLQYSLGSFVPVGGAAPAGTYDFYAADVALWVYGFDAAGNPLDSLTFPVSTCAANDADACADTPFFTRTVAAASEVPEPLPSSLIAIGLGVVALRARRRPIGTRPA